MLTVVSTVTPGDNLYRAGFPFGLGGLSFLHHHPLTGYFVTPGPCVGWPGNNGTWLNTEVCLSIIFTDE